MVKNKNETETIYYCECGQSVRLRKKDNKWIHYGWHKQFEPYELFLERTNHPVKVVKHKVWGGSIPHNEAMKLLDMG